MKLGNHIRRYRFERNEMSQEALAEAVGVTRQTIYSIEKGKFIPSALLAFKLAAFFDTTVDALFYLEKEETGNEF